MISTEIEQKIASNYWVKKIKDAPVVNEMPLDILKTKKVFINNESISYFKKLTNENAIAEYTVLLSIFSSLVQRYFETESFIFSSKIDNDEISLLFKYNSIQGKPFKGYLQEVKREVQETYQYSEYGKKLQENYPFYQYALYGFFYNSISSSIRKTSLPFSLSTNKNDEGLELSISYERSFVKDYLVNHFLNTIKNWLLHLESYIDESIDKISIVSALEKKQLLEEFNNTTVNYRKDKTIVDLFEEQTKKTPDNIAVVCEEATLTYQELNEKANQLADYLIKSYGITPEDYLGIKIERSEQLLIAILAILKTGAAYVPIDINYPKERIAYIEKDSNCKCVIDEDTYANFCRNINNFKRENPSIKNSSETVAYIIYTSGTTGNPKGVMITHQNAVAMLQWAQEEFNARKFDVVYAVTSHCFDLSIYEMFYPLSIGKKIRILDNALDIGVALQKDKKVLLNTVPSSIRNLIESGYSLDNASVINLAGEPFPIDIAKKLLETDAEIRNLYGPSEDTTYSTVYKLSSKEKYNSSIPIGNPISNTKAYILDKNLAPLPIGGSGKLYISGDGLAKGYLNRFELAAEKFISNPFIEGERMYDTGDLAKWLPNGHIEFLGRKDHQVKLRGYRIELGEIEQSILKFEGVKQVVAEVKNIGEDKAIVAYIVSEEEIDKQSLREFITKSLPEYMIPSYFIDLDAIPLTENGKIDRKALPEIDATAIIKNEYVAPRNEIEEQLAQIWQEALGIEKIGITYHFFELGGHSLKMNTMLNQVKNDFGVGISFEMFLSNPTIEYIALHIENSQPLYINLERSIKKQKIII